MFLQTPQPVSELAVLAATIAAIVTAVVGLVTAILARIDNGRHWTAVENAMKREADFAKDRDASTKELLSTEILGVSKRVEDFTKSIGERFDSQSQMIAVRLDAQESRIKTDSAAHEAALKSAEANLALKVELAQSQTTTKLGELRTAIEAKADHTTKYLVEQFKTEISALQTNNQRLEEQQTRLSTWLRKKGEASLGEPVTQD